MHRLSLNLMSGDDLDYLENHANSLLESLLDSKPFGFPFTEYKGFVRISMYYSGEADKDSSGFKMLRFLVDFPSKFEDGFGDPYNPNSAIVFLHAIEGLHATSVSNIIVKKVARAFIANPFSDIRLEFSASSSGLDGKKAQAVYWLRQPKRCATTI